MWISSFFVYVRDLPMIQCELCERCGRTVTLQPSRSMSPPGNTFLFLLRISSSFGGLEDSLLHLKAQTFLWLHFQRLEISTLLAGSTSESRQFPAFFIFVITSHYLRPKCCIPRHFGCALVATTQDPTAINLTGDNSMIKYLLYCVFHYVRQDHIYDVMIRYNWF